MQLYLSDDPLFGFNNQDEQIKEKTSLVVEDTHLKQFKYWGWCENKGDNQGR